VAQPPGRALAKTRPGNRFLARCRGALLATDRAAAGTQMNMSRRAVPFVGQHCDTPASPPSDVPQGTSEAAQGGLRRFTPALDNRVGSIVGLLANRPCPGDPFGRGDARVELARSLSHAEDLPAVGSRCLGLDPRLAKSAEGWHRCSLGPGSPARSASSRDAIRRQPRPDDGSSKSRVRCASNSSATYALRSPMTLTAWTGRVNPLRSSSPTSSASTIRSTAAWARWFSRIWPPRASPLRREARITTLPIAP
jgi:hypothetical protein